MNAKHRSVLIAVGLALNAIGAAILAVANAGCSAGNLPGTVAFSGCLGNNCSSFVPPSQPLPAPPAK